MNKWKKTKIMLVEDGLINNKSVLIRAINQNAEMLRESVLHIRELEEEIKKLKEDKNV